ncbi:MAG: PKD domain-containing protein, partial [Thermoplasmata archaeon]
PDPNGSSIWGSPAVNAKTNTVYVATGNPYTTHTSTYSESIVALNATTLKVLAAWQVPADQTVGDGDFGVTPTLFKLADGVGVVTAMNKNGCLYEWYQSNLTLRWEDSLTTQVGDRYSTSESNGKVFAVSRGPTLGGITYNASVTAINATNGAYVWQFVTNTTPTLGYGTPLIVDHVVLVPIGNTLYALQESSGRVLYAGSPGGVMVAPASFSRGEIFGGAGNDLVAYSVALGVTASQSAKSGVAPLSDSFTSAGTAGVPPYAYSWNFGGGGVSTAQDPTHVFSRPGTPTVKLTVTDLTGATLTREFTVRVHRS